MFRFFLILLITLPLFTLHAQESSPGDGLALSNKPWGYKGYAGGMFYHAGYIQSAQFIINDNGAQVPHTVKGVTSGIGGKMGFFFHKHFKIAVEGYVSTAHYGPQKNSYKLGWGGVTADVLYPIKRWVPFAGITMGMGSYTHTIFLEERSYNAQAQSIAYFDNTLLAITPALGVEYLMNKRISLLLKVDYIFNALPNTTSYAAGPRIYLGIHFYRKK